MDWMRDVQMLAQVVTTGLPSHRYHLTSCTLQSALTDSPPVSSLHTGDGGGLGTEPGLVVGVGEMYSCELNINININIEM